ncbi:MAG: hypothetical protein KatS3mg117_0361 [Geminicoccaceae bacterium]|nr:MAG: hypothetical protein KatS3mg117_0361 [Geminicoccaceae bacterium]
MSVSFTPTLLRSRAELWLVLARAFAQPSGPAYHTAFRDDLPEALASIAAELGIEAGECLRELAAAAAALAEPLDLERLYAALFLVPPAPVATNTAIYLDGALLGPSELEMNRAYERHGFVRDPAFRDLADHPTPQFEFVGRLYERAAEALDAGEEMRALALASEAERFLARFPRRWVTPFVAALERACGEAGRNAAYLWLGRFLWLALEHELGRSAVRFEDSERALPEGSSRGLGEPTAEDLAEIAVRLEAAGLGFDHVRALPAWREDVYLARRAAGTAAAG